MKFWSLVIFVILFILSILFVFISLKEDTIKIGLLYSKTGTMAASEDIIAKMVNFDVENINNSGGILGKKIEIIEYDGKSNPEEFAKGANYLSSKGVKTIFGCWTSASRKAVKPIIEKNNMILFYPLQYEGVEESKNIVYLGMTPNQQINQTLSYIKNNIGDDIYIVGSNYIYPRVVDAYIKEFSKLIGMNRLDSHYITLGDINFKEIVKDIKVKKPSAIINTINGDSNIAFFKELEKQNISSKDIPVFSTSIDEVMVKKISSKLKNNSLDGNYATWSYFNSIDTKENIELKNKLKKRYGDDFILTDAGYSISIGINLFKRAIIASKNQNVDEILYNLKMDSLNTIEGIVYLHKNNHLYKNVKIGKLENNNFKIVHSTKILSKPQPYPMIKSKEYWKKLEVELYKSWGNSWQEKSKMKALR